MTAPAAFRVLFGLLCLNHLFPSLVQAAKLQSVKLQSVNCNTLNNVTRGTIITTKPFRNYRWCGQTTRQFLAVADNKLFYLDCPTYHPNHAKGSVFYLHRKSASYQLFYETDMCDVNKETFTTKDKSSILADKLEGRLVPYDAESCNPQHYITYLRYGQIPRNINLTVSPSCPVFQQFNAMTRIDNNFRLKDQQSYYKWPLAEKAGTLTPISETRYQVPKSPPKRNSSGNSGGGWGGWFGRALSGKRGSAQRLGVVNKRGGGGGGHGGGGGGHGGGGGGHGSSGGSHGGEGSTGGEGSRGTGGFVPYYAARGGGHTSAGSRVQPFSGFKFLL